MDGAGNNNLIEVIIVILIRCGSLIREDVLTNLLCFGVDGAFVFEGGNMCYKANKRCFGTLLNGCSLGANMIT
jgi:hypothetical protein